MASFNKVILMGNLTRDPEVRYSGGGMPIVNIGMAMNRRFKDSQSDEWRDEVTFVDVTIFGKRGEAFAKFHSKGKTAFIEGSLRLDTWEDKNGGGKRSKLYVVADNWEFTGGDKREGGGDRMASSNAGGGYGESQGGGGGNYGGGQQGSDQGGGQSSGGGGGGYVDAASDTPF